VSYTRAMFFARQNPNFKEEGNFLLAKVRTSKNGEIISVRISKSSEMSAAPGGYFVRKTLVGSKSFDQAVMEVTATRGHRVKLVTVDGGELIPVREWKNLE
jgi:hypothetical protein